MRQEDRKKANRKGEINDSKVLITAVVNELAVVVGFFIDTVIFDFYGPLSEKRLFPQNRNRGKEKRGRNIRKN